MKNATITDWKNIEDFKRTILSGSPLDAYSRLKGNGRKGVYVKVSSFRNVSHTTKIFKIDRAGSFGTVLGQIFRECWTDN